MKHLGLRLEKAGHEIHIVVSDSFPELSKLRQAPFTVHTHQTPGPDWFDTPQDQVDQFIDQYSDATAIQVARLPGGVDDHMCLNLLSDEELVRRLRAIPFSLAIVDLFPYNRCALVLPYRLDLPQVALTTAYESWLMRNPDLPSYSPVNWGKGYSASMTFWERLDNTWTLIDWVALPRSPYIDDAKFLVFAPEKPYVTLNYLAGRSLLWLIDNDIALDYPRAMMPNEVQIGGMTTRPAQPLESELEKFVSSAEDGVILVSFGSLGANLPERISTKMLNVFKRLKQRVIWKVTHSHPKDIPGHIRIMSWTPQNDILGHPKTKLFITHCGANSQFEALYHGIPMICIPYMGEQAYNAERLVYNGYGLKLNLQSFTEKDLFTSITEILTNGSYRENIGRGSEIYRDRPMTPTVRAVYWIEHVLKHGGHHLRSPALDMPWYQYLLLDILLFLLSVIFCTTLAVSLSLYFLYKKVLSKGDDAKVKQQ